MLSERTRLRLAEDVTYQSLGEDEPTVLLSLTSGYLYTCNETTAAFLDALGDGLTLGQAVDGLLEQFEVSREDLCADLESVAEELIREGLIVEDAEAAG
jgi:hypothetical protein